MSNGFEVRAEYLPEPLGPSPERSETFRGPRTEDESEATEALHRAQVFTGMFSQGWELFAVTDRWAYFKRPLDPPTPDRVPRRIR